MIVLVTAKPDVQITLAGREFVYVCMRVYVCMYICLYACVCL